MKIPSKEPGVTFEQTEIKAHHSFGNKTQYEIIRKKIKDYIQSSFSYDQKIEENKYMPDHLFTMPFWTKDNSLQECSVLT